MDGRKRERERDWEPTSLTTSVCNTYIHILLGQHFNVTEYVLGA